MVKKLRKALARRPKGQIGPLEWLISSAKAAGVAVVTGILGAAHYVQDHVQLLQGTSPFWITVIVVGASAAVIGAVELHSEKQKGPDAAPEQSNPTNQEVVK